MMIRPLNDTKAWFRQRSFGYGAGLPLVWQGWALLGLHVAAMTGVALLLLDSPFALVAAVLTVAFLPVPLYAARTPGGWEWKWGAAK